jgi:hypothetical protein
LIASNPEKKHLATIGTNTRDQSDAFGIFVIAMCLLLNRLCDPAHESRWQRMEVMAGSKIKTQSEL